MKTILRTFCLAAALFVVVGARGQDSENWGGSRYVRISNERILVLYHGATLDFQLDAGWDIADAAQKQQFEAWVKKANLPKDPSQFVADLPPAKAVPLVGEIEVDLSSDDEAVVRLKYMADAPSMVNLHHATGWIPDTSGRTTLAEYAAKLHTSASALLVALSGASKPTEEQAWTKLVSRAQSATGFVTLMGGSKEALWSHSGIGSGTSALPQSSPKPKLTQPDQRPSKGYPAWMLPAVIGGTVVVLVGLGFAWPGVRTRVLGSVHKPAQTGSAAFPLGAHERELILKVREEGKRHPLPANAPHSEEEYAVGMMLDRYQAYDTLIRERDLAQRQAEALQSYKEYQAKTEEFERRYAAAKDSVAKLEAEAAKQKKIAADLREKLSQAETYVKNLEQQRSELAKSLSDADALLAETSTWTKAVSDRLSAQAAKIHHE